MTGQKKVKLVISLAILIIVALFAIVTIQIVNISKAKKEISNQQKQIQQLEKQLNSYEKTPNADYEEIT